MGFSFGSIGDLDPNISLICFATVILFVVFFDHFLGLLEYFLEGSYLYNKMLQTMYKELMLTGFVSFSIMMFSASREKYAEHDRDWILNIDFAGILISYITIFFVFHAFYLMRSSTLNRRTNRRLFHTSVSELIQGVKEMKQSDRVTQALYAFKYLPLSSLRAKVEFFLCYAVCRDTYWLPENFDYPGYLNGCYDRFALKTIDRSLFSWLALFLITLLNYGRVRSGFGCTISSLNDDSADEDKAGEARFIAASSGDDNLDQITFQYAFSTTDNCAFETTKLLLFCGLLVFLFSLILTMISRVYNMRLCNRIGFQSIDEYVDFLLYSRAEEQKAELRVKLEKSGSGALLSDADRSINRISIFSLKHDIELVIDNDEHIIDDQKRHFKKIGDFILRLWDTASEYFNYVIFHLKLNLLSIFISKRSKTLDVVTRLSSKRNSIAQQQQQKQQQVVVENSLRGTKRASIVHRMSGENFPTRGSKRVSMVQRMSEDISLRELEEGSNRAETFRRARRSSAIGSLKKEQVVIQGGHEDGDDATSGTPHTRRKYKEEPSSGDDAAILGDGSQHVRNPFRSRKPSLFSGEIPALAFGNISCSDGSKKSLFTMLSKLEGREKSVGSIFSRGSSYAAATQRSNNNEHEATSLLSSREGGSFPSRQRKNSVKVRAPDGLESTIEKYQRLKFQESFYSFRDKQRIDEEERTRTTGSTNSATIWERMYWWFKGLTAVASSSSMEDADEDVASDSRLSEDFSDIYFFKRPTWYFRAIEFCILLNCIYGAVYVTNFITITNELQLNGRAYFFLQLVLAAPLFIVIPSIGFIARTGAMLSAIGELNLSVAKEVIDLTLETEKLKSEFRSYIFAAVESLKKQQNADPSTFLSPRELIEGLFEELNEDGSGELGRLEFRFMLRVLKLKYSDHRFNLLFLAMDKSENGTINLKDLNTLVFDEEIEEAPKVNVAVGGGIEGLRSQFKSELKVSESEGGNAPQNDSEKRDRGLVHNTNDNNSHSSSNSSSSSSDGGDSCEHANEQTVLSNIATTTATISSPQPRQEPTDLTGKSRLFRAASPDSIQRYKNRPTVEGSQPSKNYSSLPNTDYPPRLATTADNNMDKKGLNYLSGPLLDRSGALHIHRPFSASKRPFPEVPLQWMERARIPKKLHRHLSEGGRDKKKEKERKLDEKTREYLPMENMSAALHL